MTTETAPIAHSSNAARTGVLIMLLGMLMFSLNDVMGKWLVSTYSVPQLMTIRSIAALIVLTPFSQNSNEDPCSGSPQAQPGQSKPSGWLAFKSARAPEIGEPLSKSRLPQLFSAPQPPAALERSPMKTVLPMNVNPRLLPIEETVVKI